MFIKNLALIAISVSSLAASTFALYDNLTSTEVLTKLYGKESAIPKALRKSIGSCNFVRHEGPFGIIEALLSKKDELPFYSVSKASNKTTDNCLVVHCT